MKSINKNLSFRSHAYIYIGSLAILATVLPVQAGFNVPTASVNKITGIAVPEPSPLCIGNAQGNHCATEFTAKLLNFEEFGTSDAENIIESKKVLVEANTAFPAPESCDSGPDGALLDAFIKDDINSIPLRVVDQNIPNPWEKKINDCLQTNIKTVAEGRPGGEEFSHQGWSNFPFMRILKSVQTGARINGGVRDKSQLHAYKFGEFGPNGLFTIDADNDGVPGTRGIKIKIHPNLPEQDKNSVWTFDGTLPPKLLMHRVGNSLLFRHYNGLPIDEAANRGTSSTGLMGFGRHTITTHLHNGHNPGESDGFLNAFFHPGQFYDYHWPMILAGHDETNASALDPRAGYPNGHGGNTLIPGDWRETQSSLWFHDHMDHFTAQNVYKGNAAAINLYSAVDRGREPLDLIEAQSGLGKAALNPLTQSVDLTSDANNSGYACHYMDPNNVNLCFPSGTHLDWGNRDYDVNLLVGDKAWDSSGQLKFNLFNLDGFLGDRVTVNWQYKPFMEVRPRRYRLRLLDGSVSRNFKFAIVKELVDAKGVKSYTKVPFHMIANDGNIMEHSVKFPNAFSPDGLPEQATGERYDIIIDFAGLAKGTKLYMVNILEHVNGKGPNKILPLVDVLAPAKVDGVASKNVYIPDGIKGDPAVGKFLELRVADMAPVDMSKPYQPDVNLAGYNPARVDYSMNPAEYEENGKVMIPINRPTQAELATAVHRTFDYGHGGGVDNKPWNIKADGGAALVGEINQVASNPKSGAVEIWHFKTGGGWAHPVHAHFEEGITLYRGGKTPPPWERFARKDVFRIGPISDSTKSVDIAIRFRDFAGTYVEHCHNTQHEDHAMLLRWDINHPGQTIAFPTPMPDWDGVHYEPSIYLETAKIGDVKAGKGFVVPSNLPK